MEKTKLLLFPLIMGIILMLCSWCLSYPLSIDFPGDFVFNHISPLYWFSLPLLLASLYLLGVFSKSNSLKCIVCVAAILVIYSLSFFYYSLPTGDSQYFRGLTEYFINTKILDPSQINHAYFQWPSFFLLADITTSVTGLKLIDFEFLLYTIIGLMLTVTLYVYASKLYKKWAFLIIMFFFISMFWFLNYQAVPFSLALMLTLILFMLETIKKSPSVILAMIFLFCIISITHLFVGLFFVLYLFLQAIIRRNKLYAGLSITTLFIYLLSQFTLGSYWIYFYIRGIFEWVPEYSSVVQRSLEPVLLPFDAIAQNMSRVVTISAALFCFVGFVFLLIKRRLRTADKAIFLTGAVFSGLGVFLHTLGLRALSILFIPISLGVAYLLETKLKSYLKVIFLILLVLFVFVPLHNSYNSFSDSFIPIQTKEAFNAEHFLMDHFDWTNPSVILTHTSVESYLLSSLNTEQINATFDNDFSPLFPRLREYDCVLYTVGLGNSFLKYNFTMEEIANEEKLNVIYNNGFSEIATRGSHFALATP